MSLLASLLLLFALLAGLISAGVYHRSIHALMRRLALNHADTWRALDGPRLSPEAWEQVLSWQSLGSRALFPPGNRSFLRRFIRYVVGKQYRALHDVTTVQLGDRTRRAFLTAIALVAILFVYGCFAKVSEWIA